MGDIGGEVGPDAFGGLDLGHVGDEDGGAHILPLILPPGDGGEEEAQAAPGQGQVVHVQHDRALLLVALLGGLPQAAAAGEHQESRGIAGGVLRNAEEAPGGPVAGQEPAVLVQQEETLVHAVQNEVDFVPLRSEVVDGAAQPLHQFVDIAQDGAQFIIPAESVQCGRGCA